MHCTTLEQSISEKHALYREQEAILEAERCLYCYDPPCVKACPTEINIPNFIRKIANKDKKSAAKTILSANILGDSCAKVCPVEVLCAGSCVLHQRHEEPIAIGRLQRFATENIRERFSIEEILGPKKSPRHKKVAFVGAGAASLAAAALLAREGYESHIFDKRSFAGGLNAYGIAPYKLFHEAALLEIDWLKALGLKFHFGCEVDEAKAKSLIKEYDAVFLGIGLGGDKMLSLPGLENEGVFGATELIEKIKTDPTFSLATIKRAHIVGGGNTAIDIAHELSLLGVPYVAMLYRSSEAAMSGYAHEMAAARKSGVHFFPHSEVLKILSHEGQLRAIITNQSDDEIASDALVFAIGQQGATSIARYFDNVELDERSLIKVNENYRTNNPKIWSAGDAVNGGKEVVNAVAEAKIAVRDMIQFLEGTRFP